MSNDYYPALTSPNVDVITEGIREIRERSILDRADREREVDVIIFATGFKVQELVPRGMFFGSGGRDLADAWRDGPEAYKGTTVAGFPNLFFLLGPNTGLGHSSVIFMIESQVAYVLDALRQMRTNGWSTLEVQAEAQAAFNRELDSKSASAVWKSGCRSWYLTESGRNTTMWPDFTFRFRHLTRRFDSRAYRASPGRVLASAVSARSRGRAGS
jgi:cyclohexanone monooxygenase